MIKIASWLVLIVLLASCSPATSLTTPPGDLLHPKPSDSNGGM